MSRWLLLVGATGLVLNCAEASDGVADNKPLPDAATGSGGSGPIDGGGWPDAIGGECSAGQTTACYTGPAATQGIGSCKDGVATCQDASFGACVGEQLPQTEACDGVDNDCNGVVDEGCSCVNGEQRPCYSGPTGTRGVGECTDGVQTCASGAWSNSCAGQTLPKAEACNGKDDDCDGQTDEALTQPCSTACGTGSATCTAGSYSQCSAAAPSAETCNLADDDCDGECDEGAGCRVAVHRSVSTLNGGHFYTTSQVEASCCGFTVEHLNFFRVYSAPTASLVPFYRCLLANGFYFYTTAPSCEGAAGASQQLVVGYVASSAVCGAVPLYRLVKNHHFYTVSAAERDNAIAAYGFVDEGVAGYVWLTP